jgi:hypothetical protein
MHLPAAVAQRPHRGAPAFGEGYPHSDRAGAGHPAEATADTADQAFALLTRLSQEGNEKFREVARRLAESAGSRTGNSAEHGGGHDAVARRPPDLGRTGQIGSVTLIRVRSGQAFGWSERQLCVQ